PARHHLAHPGQGRVAVVPGAKACRSWGRPRGWVCTEGHAFSFGQVRRAGQAPPPQAVDNRPGPTDVPPPSGMVQRIRPGPADTWMWSTCPWVLSAVVPWGRPTWSGKDPTESTSMFQIVRL